MKQKLKIKVMVTAILIVLFFSSCMVKTVSTNNSLEEKYVFGQQSDSGNQLEITFTKGKDHNHPSLSIWIETTDGQLVKTLFVTRSIATGYFQHGDAGDGKWLTIPGEAQRPAALPYWLHKREKYTADQPLLPNPQHPVPDAITSATPKGSFNLSGLTKLPNRFVLWVEVNQAWDWNSFYTNNLHPGDKDYHTSAQPSLIYAVTVDANHPMEQYSLNPVGHGHHAGADGNLYTDLSGFTTAKHIFETIVCKVR